MDCPHCGFENSRVIDSRDVNKSVRRRRQCPSCGSRFTTYERIETRSLQVIKKDRPREEFKRDKLAGGIIKACEKRPLPSGTIDKIVDSEAGQEKPVKKARRRKEEVITNGA